MESIVIYRLGSLGDTVVALPCFHAIARAFPDARRILLTNVPVSQKAAPLAAILGGSGLVHEYLSYPVGTRSLGDLLRLARQLRALRPAALVYLTPARGRMAALRDLLYFRLCGIPKVIGAPVSAELQSVRVDTQSGVVERECERLARCMKVLEDIDLADPASWDLRLTEAELQRGAAAIQPFGGGKFIAVNMGGKHPRNDWGIARWTTLLARVTGRWPGYGLLIVGGPEDRERAAQASRSWQGVTVNACGELLPRESAAALRHASLFVGHDSGPMHLAAAGQVPCVGMFSELNPPAKWHPYGPHHRPVHRMEGIDALTVDEVMGAVSQILP